MKNGYASCYCSATMGGTCGFCCLQEDFMNDADRAFCESVIVAGNHAAKFSTFEIVERICEAGIVGDFAEAGVGGGGQIAVMDAALRKHNDARFIHAFDSFAGIPKATAEDGPEQQREYGVRQEGEWLESSGKLMATEDQFWNNMTAWGVRTKNVRVLGGWFQESLPLWAKRFPRDLALLRIDVDLVESVRLCMTHLYPRLVTGGYCIFDDWGMKHEAFPPCRIELLKFFEGLPMPEFMPVEGNDGTVYFLKP